MTGSKEGMCFSTLEYWEYFKILMKQVLIIQDGSI